MSRLLVSRVDRIKFGLQVGSVEAGVRVDSLVAGIVYRTATVDTVPTGTKHARAIVLAVNGPLTVMGCNLPPQTAPPVGGDLGQGSVDDLYVLGEWSAVAVAGRRPRERVRHEYLIAN